MGQLMIRKNEIATAVGRDFEWKFTTQSDISQFRNCSNGHRLTTVKFMMHHFVFHFAVIHNQNGHCFLSLIPSAFPPNIQSLGIILKVKCKEIKFNSKTSGSITELNAFTIHPMTFASFRLLE